MAQVAAIEPETKPKTGGNDRENVPEQSAKDKRSSLPKPLAFTLRDEDFYAYTKALTPADWAHTAMYTYRLKPPIIRTPSNIDSPTVAMDEQYVLDNYGSGKYEIKLNDIDKRATVCRCLLEINRPDYPPKIDMRELDVTHKDNRLLVEKLKREGKLAPDGSVVQGASGDGADSTMANALKDIALEAMKGRTEKPGLEGQAFSKMLDMMSNASAKSIDIALAQLKGNEKSGSDPAILLMMQFMMKQLELADKRADQQPVKQATEDPIFKLMFAQLEQSRSESAALRDAAEKERQRNHDFQMKMMEVKADAASPTAMVKEVLELQREIAQLGNDDARNWKEKLVDQGFQALPDILSAVKGYTQRAAPVQQQQQQPRPQQQPAQAPPAQSAPPSTTTQETNMPAQNTNSPAALDPDIGFLLSIFEMQGRQFVSAFINDPLSGGDVARTVSLFAGAATYERIARMGREKILGTIELLPEMKADLLKAGSPEMLNEFIDDFIAGPEGPDEDEDDPVIPEGVTKKQRPPKKAAA